MCYVNYEEKGELSFPFSYLRDLKLTSFIKEYSVDFRQKGDPYFFCHYHGNSLDFLFKYFDNSLLESAYCYLEYEDKMKYGDDVTGNIYGFYIVDLKERLLDILTGKLYCDCVIEIEFKEKEKK